MPNDAGEELPQVLRGLRKSAAASPGLTPAWRSKSVVHTYLRALVSLAAWRPADPRGGPLGSALVCPRALPSTPPTMSYH